MDEREVPPATGRTSSDAAVEISRDALDRMGRGAPYLVLLIVVGFGIFKFMALQDEKMRAVQAARLQAQQENLDTITRLKDQVLADSTAITDLQGKSVEVINRQVEAHQKILGTITGNLETIATLSEKAQRRELELREQTRQIEALRVEHEALMRSVAAREDEERALRARIDALEQTSRVARHLVDVLNRNDPLVPTREIAQIAERYEGVEPSHIGEDYAGHFYYGTFRIRGHTEMAGFIGYLEGNHPEIADTLLKAGGAEAAAQGRLAFTRAWQRLARDPAFEAAQRAFISDRDYRKAVRTCKLKGGLDIAGRAIAVQSVFWAMTVQHGSSGAARLCEEAASALGEGKPGDAALIDEFYRLRVTKKRELFPGLDGVIHNLFDVRYALEKADAKIILDAFPSAGDETPARP